LFLEITLKFFKIFIEHVLAAEFIPASEMVDFHSGQHSMFFEDPINLLFLAPHHIPVIIICLFPLSLDKSLKNAIFERGFKFDIGTE